MELPGRTICQFCRHRVVDMFDPRDLEVKAEWRQCESGCSLGGLLLDSIALDPVFSHDRPRGQTHVWAVDLGTVTWTPQESDPDTQALDAQDLKARKWKRIKEQNTVTESYERKAIYYNVWTYQDKKHPVSNVSQAYHRHFSPRNNLFTSRPLGSQIDLVLASSWMRACDLLHQPTCTPLPWHGMGESALRMVDVQNRCVVAITAPVEYFALSYCWGDPKEAEAWLQLKESTAMDLYNRNALADDRTDLPQTIRDAILLTQRLGGAFLWVDALCICQDSDADMSAQVRHMDKVYKHAKLTIVCAAGNDAHAGIPGLREGTRTTRQLSRRIGKMRFYARDRLISFASALKKSTWNERAWTLQEQILSHRLLIFTGSEMSWNCECAIWTEGMVLECFAPGTTLELSSQFRGCVKPPSGFTPLQKFNYYLGYGSGRKLTYEKDRLTCMQGLFNTLAPHFAGGFHWGMPVSVFDSALLFHGVLWQEAPWKRRTGFPSWSWAGWNEAVACSDGSPYDNDNERWWSDVYISVDISPTTAARTRKEVAWHVVNEAESDWTEISSIDISTDGSVYYTESRSRWHHADPQQMLQEARQRFIQAGIPFSHALGFWTQTVHLRVDREEATGEHVGSLTGVDRSSPSRDVRDKDGNYVCYILLTHEYRESQPDDLYFILLGHHRRWDRTHGGIVEIMHVETKDGITRRVQGVRECVLNLEAWDKLDTRWEWIVMA
ncbi:hypothetical protein PV04_03630 [Phialophora macrospora]|uniref:Heterokaryon incompatibility domain-containing protein n=1 Tax=Phialophora macrospora TaxID=1851006 RepID=A0A0D2FYE7_9EURO|nr:hypothetical protein PV04_03630 [Phialophora macrospora]